MTTISPTIFRAYDIRGVVGKELSEAVYEVLGRAAGTLFRNRHSQTIVVGYDARLTSPTFAAAYMRGLQTVGCDVIDIGMVPTPVMYFAVDHLKADGGAVITASHNPPEFNGLKMRHYEPQYGGVPFSSEEVQEVGRIAISGQFASGHGSYRQVNVEDAYVEHIAALVTLPRRLKVVVDGGNGVAGPLGVRVFERLGCEVVPLFIEPDGTFPNHHPDPLKEKNMQDLTRVVRETGAELGIGLDGDGDRLGVIDDQGTMVFADRYMIVLAREALKKGPAPIVFDVKCSTVLADAITALGGTPVMWKTGYTNQSAKMRELGAPVAGELSGHIFNNRPGHSFDDGTFAGVCLIEALVNSGQTLSQALAPYPVRAEVPEERIELDDTRKFAAVEFVRAKFAKDYDIIETDGLRIDFGDGWGLLRASNTEPVITTRFEAETEARAAHIRDVLLGALREYTATQ
jgi:phosphomannomutase